MAACRATGTTTVRAPGIAICMPSRTLTNGGESSWLPKPLSWKIRVNITTPVPGSNWPRSRVRHCSGSLKIIRTGYGVTALPMPWVQTGNARTGNVTNCTQFPLRGVFLGLLLETSGYQHTDKREKTAQAVFLPSGDPEGRRQSEDPAGLGNMAQHTFPCQLPCQARARLSVTFAWISLYVASGTRCPATVNRLTATVVT